MSAPLIKLGLLLCCALGFSIDLAQAKGDAGLRRAVAAQRALPAAPMLPRAAFRTRTGIRDIQLSPDGRWLAYSLADSRNNSLWLLQTATGQRRKLLATTTATSRQWSRDSRTLVLVAGDRVATLSVAGGRPQLVMALREQRRQEFLAVDPNLPRHFLVRDTDPGDGLHRFWRIDFDGRRELLFTGKQAVAGFAFDRQGRLAFVQVATDQENVILRREQRAWKPFLRCGAIAECRLLSISSTGELLMVSDRDANFQRVVAVDPVSGKMRPLHSDPETIADLFDLVLDTRSGRPRIASYFTDRRHNYGLDTETQRQIAEIERQFPQAELEIAIGNEGAWLLTERGDRLQLARYHLYDPRHRRTTTVLEDQQAPSRKLLEAALSRKIALEYRASDGMQLHGFLLLPPGRDAAKLPLIAMVHGGPYSQVRREFDVRLQFLANRGYAVFQPNFRASTGYGRAYEAAAKGDFGNGRVQRDIVEGLDYLLAQGIGDPARQAIEGHSFGGYSTLLALSHTPDRFRVGIAAAPSPDFGWTLKSMAQTDSNTTRVPLRAQFRARAIDVGDPALLARLRADSPERQVDAVRRRLLIIAGARDDRVAIRSLTHYVARLKAAGKDVAFLVDPESGHQLEAPLAREAYFYLLERELQRYLGGRAETAISAPLRDYLQRNLRDVSGDPRAQARAGGN